MNCKSFFNKTVMLAHCLLLFYMALVRSIVECRSIIWFSATSCAGILKIKKRVHNQFLNVIAPYSCSWYISWFTWLSTNSKCIYPHLEIGGKSLINFWMGTVQYCRFPDASSRIAFTIPELNSRSHHSYYLAPVSKGFLRQPSVI